MNMQNMLKEAQKMQQQMIKRKEEIDKKIFPGKYSFVDVEVNGKKEVLKITINKDSELIEEDIEILEDILVIAINDAFKKVDREINEKMGNLGSGIFGLL